MNYMSKIGVIGDYDSICGFAALGLDIYPEETPAAAEETLKRLAKGDYGILYVTENYLEKMQEVVAEYAQKELPAIIPIPSASGTTGYGISTVKHYVEQAVGSDIIFND